MNKVRSLTAVGAAAVLFAGCQDTNSPAPAGIMRAESRALSVSAVEGRYSPQLDQIRQQLAGSGVKNVQLAGAEISVAADSAGWQGATTLYANDRTHTLSEAFVPRDPRRDGRANITYIVDQSNELAVSRSATNPQFILTKTQLEPEIDASMLRWQNQPSCGAPEVTKVAYTGADPDLIDGIVLNDPSRIGTPFADITQAGWLSRPFFDALAPNGSSFILGVTFSFVFVDANNVPTDIDHDGRQDVAFREIYYNQRFFWTTDPTFTGGVDVQSVATHESGHAYGLGHFGKVFVDNKGVIQYAPRAVMNAVYASSYRDLAGSDNSSFCQLWANAK
jgi:methylmalonyl-CoA mutase cobalamin-binding subunit